MATSQLQHGNALPHIPSLHHGSSPCHDKSQQAAPTHGQPHPAQPAPQQDSLFQNLIEHSPNPIARYSLTLDHLYVNQAYAALTTHPTEQLLQSSLDMLPFPATNIASLKHAILTATTTKQPYCTELPLHPHSHAASFFKVHILPEFDSSNRVISTLLSGCDITSLKQTTLRQHVLIERMEAQEPKIAATAGTVGIALIDLQGEIHSVNQLLLDTVGATEQNLSPGVALRDTTSLSTLLCTIIAKTLSHFRTTASPLSFHHELSSSEKRVVPLLVQASLMQSLQHPSPLIALSISTAPPVRTIEQELHHIESQLTSPNTASPPAAPYRLDINTTSEFLTLIGQQTLTDILSEFLDLLGTCAAVHDPHGTYLLGLFAPGWCSLLDQATPHTQQPNGLHPARCHLNCLRSAKARNALNQHTACTLRCSGGLQIHAVPIVVAGALVGSISVGFGSPPLDNRRLQRLSERFGIDAVQLRQEAQRFDTRTSVIQDIARKRLLVAARMMGSLLLRRRAQQTLKERQLRTEQLIIRRSRQLLAANQRLQSEIKHHLTTQQVLNSRQEALETIYAIVTAFSSTLQEMCDQMITYIAHSLKVPFASIVVITEGKIRLVSQFCFGTLQSSPTIDLNAHPIRFCLENRNVCSPGATGGHAELRSKNCMQATPQNSAYCGIPLPTSSGTLVGGVCVLDTLGRAFDDHQMLLLEIFSRYIAHEVSRTSLEEQLRQAEEMRTLGQLTSGVAHEVRNPLNAIQAISEALFMEIGHDEIFQPFMHHISHQVARLSQLMKDLLELGHTEQHLRLEQTELGELLSEIIDTWKNSTKEETRAVELVLPPPPSLSVFVDCARFQQAIFNLLENGAHHCHPSFPLTIKVSTETALSVKIEVIDRGKGVETEVQEQLFKPFFTTRKGGTGLGLSIVRHIVEMHGGHASLHNNPSPPGAVATITLPLLHEQHLPSCASSPPVAIPVSTR